MSKEIIVTSANSSPQLPSLPYRKRGTPTSRAARFIDNGARRKFDLGVAVQPAAPVVHSRKTYRTYLLNEEGVLVDAKIDMLTGEVTPHEYKKRPSRPRLRPVPISAAVEPPWVRIEPPNQPVSLLSHDKSYKRQFNDLKLYLHGYFSLWEALEDIPVLDSIIQGALALDLGGNSRSLNASIVFALLQQLQWVTSKTVQAFLDCSERHAQKVVQVLHIIIKAFRSEVEGRGHHA